MLDMCTVSVFERCETRPVPASQLKEVIYTVAVRELCEFAAKVGDLDLRFTPSPNAQEGIAGHKVIAARRGASYRTELSLSGRFRQLLVRGRADGFDAERALLEEFKTFKGDLECMPANHRALHWAQLKVYGWLLCDQSALPTVTLSLVYFEIASQRETTLIQQFTAAELKRNFESLAERFLTWAHSELDHRTGRDRALNALRFPHSSFRTGQRSLAENVFRAARHGRCLLAQAPTGIGKTIGTLFPLFKAAPEQQLDKIFFLSAKGTGREVALQAIDKISNGESAIKLRWLELVAREKACEHPDKACHGESCPLAQGFYDRLPRARAAAVANGRLTQAVLRDIALAHSVCPYYLSQELVRWSDVVVADYNYYFDDSALLHALTLTNGWRVAVLVDEAHNLIDRARAMYSATLSQSDLHSISRSAPEPLRLPLQRLNRAWKALTTDSLEDYRAHSALPIKFIAALHAVAGLMGDLLAEPVRQPDEAVLRDDALLPDNALLRDKALPHNDALLRFHFDLVHFIRMSDRFGEHSLFDVQRAPDPALTTGRGTSSTVCLRNVIPAPFLQPRFAAAHTTVLFSATLTPTRFYSDTLGLPDDVASVAVDSPFESAQLSVQLISTISTRFERRDRSLGPIASLIATRYGERPGNYLAFFSSFDYLQRVASTLATQQPLIPIWQQSRAMNEADRQAFLARFTEHSCGIGFAVLGGVFAEGIDLPGSRLIGAFIATLGLPQFNAVNQEMRRRIDALLGSGYQYTYLFPGLRKVVQAGGRVIRTTSDRGRLFLIDDRYAHPEVRALLPAWWSVVDQVSSQQRPSISLAQS
jgi:DNA excision repair protein ERCC-2